MLWPVGGGDRVAFKYFHGEIRVVPPTIHAGTPEKRYCRVIPPKRGASTLEERYKYIQTEI